jgi:hypothetical protein
MSYGRASEGNAVCYLADREEADLVLDLLAQPRNHRLCYAAQLARFVSEQERRPVWQRQCVPFRRSGGVFRLMPWRLAKWLSYALAAPDPWRERTSWQIRTWLSDPNQCRIAGGALEIGR